VRVEVAGRFEGGKERRVVQHRTGRLDPVVVEGRLELRHHGPLDAEMDVPPVFGILGPALPVIGNPDAPGKAHPAIHHEDLAMGPVVEPAEVEPAKRTIPVDLGAGVLHLGESVAVHLHAPRPVEDDVDGQPGPGALRG
jgi:hypothetical protein